MSVVEQCEIIFEVKYKALKKNHIPMVAWDIAYGAPHSQQSEQQK